MDYIITNRVYGEYPHVEALVSTAVMADPSTLPEEWPAGSLIYTVGYASIKQKGLDDTWSEVNNDNAT